MILDVSEWQGAINWDAVMGAPGLEGVLIRASHGHGVDLRFAVNAYGAHRYRRAGQWIGYYHFAEYLADEVLFGAALHSGAWIEPDRLVCDVEGAIPGNVLSWLTPRLAAADTIPHVLPERTWNYTYASEAGNLAPLGRLQWVARVADGAGNPGTTPPGGNYALWQYSWVGRWPGIGGNVDLSRVGPGYPTDVKPKPPPPPPKPIPPHVLIPGELMDVTTMPLDAQGNGQVAVPGVHPTSVKSTMVVGLHDPSEQPMGYVRIPKHALDTRGDVAEVVLEDGVPGGRYVIRINTV